MNYNVNHTSIIMDKAIESIKEQYQMPFLKVGMNVLVNKRAVKITGVGNSGLKGKLVTGNRDTVYFHPTWETTYCDENWNVLHDYRKKI